MKIILFGSTGMLGNYIHLVLKHSYNILCITREMFDIENDKFSIVKSLLIREYEKDPDIICINCAGVIHQKCGNSEYKKYIRINSLFPHIISNICEPFNVPFIHITTDCVYDGTVGDYSTLHPHTATDIYGISKSIGEPEYATIIRTSIIGEELKHQKSLLEWVKQQSNSQINGYDNHLWNGVTCLALSNIIKNTIDNNTYWNGVKHVASENSITKYELCTYINTIYGLNIKILHHNSNVNKNMTLLPDIIERTPIFNQIKEMYEFSKSFN